MLPLPLPTRNGIRRGKRSAVGNADMHFRNAKSFAGFAGSTTQRDSWPARGVISNFDVVPADTARPARPHRFQHGLFCGPPPGVMLRGRFARTAVANFVLCENAIQKQFRMSIDHLSDPQAFDDVGSDTDDVHDSSAR